MKKLFIYIFVISLVSFVFTEEELKTIKIDGNTNEYPVKEIIILKINIFFLLNKLRANGNAKIQLINEDKKACIKEIYIILKLYLF